MRFVPFIIVKKSESLLGINRKIKNNKQAAAFNIIRKLYSFLLLLSGNNQ
jgi:hypothetical protein